MARKTLDVKLTRMRADASVGDLILADAKDADMAFGIASPDRRYVSQEDVGGFRSLQEYREFMLVCANSSDVLTSHERLFDDRGITPAIRADDTTELRAARG